MSFQVVVTGRRISDNNNYELSVTSEASCPKQAEDEVLKAYDFEDAATLNVQVTPLTIH